MRSMKKDVLGGRLFHAACRRAGGALGDIPLSFPNEDAYISTFEPLLWEEAREQVGQWVTNATRLASLFKIARPSAVP